MGSCTRGCDACNGTGRLPVLNPARIDQSAPDAFRIAVEGAAVKVRANVCRDSADVWRKIPDIIAAEFAPLATENLQLRNLLLRAREDVECGTIYAGPDGDEATALLREIDEILNPQEPKPA